jgi:hypothetical protein
MPLPFLPAEASAEVGREGVGGGGPRAPSDHGVTPSTPL